MIRKTLLYFLAATCVSNTFANSVFSLTFGPPLIVSNSLIFAESNVSALSRRIICINRYGRRLWDIERDEGYVQVWFSISNSVIVTTATDILLVNADSGTIAKSHNGHFQNSCVRKFAGTSVLICHDKEGVNTLSCLEMNSGKFVWQIKNITRVIDDGSNIVLCKFVDRGDVGANNHNYVKRKLCAIKGDDGGLLWDYPLEASFGSDDDLDGGRVGNYFIVANSGNILCFEDSTGKIVSHRQIDPSLVPRMSLFIKDRIALLWFPLAARISTTNYPTLSRITIPDLSINGVLSVDDSTFMKVVFFSDAAVVCRSIGWTKAYNCQTGELRWNGGQWNCGGVSDGWLYFSEAEYFGKRSSIKRVNILTGRIEKIYEEERRDIVNGNDISTNDVNSVRPQIPDI